jgi:large subunit ribosomal protein L10
MALSRDKKNEIMAELEQLFASSKMTVVAQYKGLTVKNIQQLRAEARENGTTIKVVKNRLVRKAMQNSTTLKDVDASALRDMLMYVFNPNDETAGAQVLAKFAKKNPEVQFVGGITADGTFMNAAEIKTFASLPSKNELVAGIVSILQSPTRNVMAQLTGNLHGMLDAVAAHNSK